MANKYGLPELELERVRARDVNCVYCDKAQKPPSPDVPASDWATIEHLNRFPPFNDPSTIAICCMSCNASRGNKKIIDWFETKYCRQHSIGLTTVAQSVLDFLNQGSEV